MVLREAAQSRKASGEFFSRGSASAQFRCGCGQRSQSAKGNSRVGDRPFRERSQFADLIGSCAAAVLKESDQISLTSLYKSRKFAFRRWLGSGSIQPEEQSQESL